MILYGNFSDAQLLDQIEKYEALKVASESWVQDCLELPHGGDQTMYELVVSHNRDIESHLERLHEEAERRGIDDDIPFD